MSMPRKTHPGQTYHPDSFVNGVRALANALLADPRNTELLADLTAEELKHDCVVVIYRMLYGAVLSNKLPVRLGGVLRPVHPISKFLFADERGWGVPLIAAAEIEPAAFREIWRISILNKSKKGSIHFGEVDCLEFSQQHDTIMGLTPVFGGDMTQRRLHFTADKEYASMSIGSPQKEDGVFYTPGHLVNYVLDRTLEPMLKSRYGSAEGAAVGEPLKVLDPACGTGNFLAIAARRVKAYLGAAGVIPVIRDSLYGVELDPMAAALCRLNLYLEAYRPHEARPPDYDSDIVPAYPSDEFAKMIAALDAHILCGNSIHGVRTAADLDAGISDHAYEAEENNPDKALDTRNRHVCTRLRTANAAKGEGIQIAMFEELDAADHSADPRRSYGINGKVSGFDDFEAGNLRARRARDDAEGGERKACDLWAGAFLVEKIEENELIVPLTSDMVRARRGLPERKGILDAARDEVGNGIHWHLDFKSPMATGGFDVVVGNPPWKIQRIYTERFVSQRDKDWTFIGGDDRRAKVEAVYANGTPKQRAIWLEFRRRLRRLEAGSAFCKSSGRYPLTCDGVGNLFKPFAETMIKITSPDGRAGIVLPTQVFMTIKAGDFYKWMCETERLASFETFEAGNFFHNIGAGVIFAVLVATGGERVKARYAFGMRTLKQASEKTRQTDWGGYEETAIFNPQTRGISCFKSQPDLDLARKIYERAPALCSHNDEQGGWGLFVTVDRFRGVPLAEMVAGVKYHPQWKGGAFKTYDHRHGTLAPDGRSVGPVTGKRREINHENWTIDQPLKDDPTFEVVPINYCREDDLLRAGGPRAGGYTFAFRQITGIKARRALVGAAVPFGGCDQTALRFVFPKYVGANQSLLSIEHELSLFAIYNSLVCDWIFRFKYQGPTINSFHLDQLPILPRREVPLYWARPIAERVCALSCTSNSMVGMAEQLRFNKGRPVSYNRQHRTRLHAEIDAAIAHLYRLTRSELLYLIDPRPSLGEGWPSYALRHYFYAADEEGIAQGRPDLSMREQLLVAYDGIAKNGFVHLQETGWAARRGVETSAFGTLAAKPQTLYKARVPKSS